MKSTELATILVPFAALANRHAMSLVYKALEVSTDTIRGCSPWGILEVDAEIGTKETFWVDAAQFIGAVKGLPAAEVVFTQTGTTLNWTCDNAQGKIALLSKLDIPTYDWEGPQTETPNIDSEFPEALKFGSLSASRDIGMSSAGVTGVAFTWLSDDATLYITSSDNVTMSVSSAEIQGAEYWPETIVISTEAAMMLGTVLRMSSGSSGAWMEIHEKMIIAYAQIGVSKDKSNDFRLMIRAAPPMQHDILALTLNYPHDEIVTRLPSDVVKRFVTQAASLAEAKAHTHVKIMAINGALRLSFVEGTIMSDEQYKIAELVLPQDFPEVRLDAGRLARALDVTDKLAFDAFERGVLTLFTEGDKEKKKPPFAYLINGAQEKGA